MIQNRAPEKTRPLRLRAAVINTKLAGSVCMEDFDSFADIKRELLLAFGRTPATAWRELMSSKQRPLETFRQYCLHVSRWVKRWRCEVAVAVPKHLACTLCFVVSDHGDSYTF
eukprot:scpid101439/ scgid31958/ 